MAIVQNKGTTELYHIGTPRHSGKFPYGSGYNPKAWLEDHNMTLAEYHGLDKKQREEEEAKRKVAEGIKALKRYDEMDEATPFAANKYISKKLRVKIQKASVEELQKMLDAMHKEADNGRNSFRKKDYDDIEAEISRETVGRAIRANIRIKNGDWTAGKDDGSIGYHLRNMVHSYYKTGEPYDLSSAKKSYPKMSNVQLRTAIDDVITRRNAYIPYLMKYGYSKTEAKRTVSALTDALMTEARSRNLLVSKTGNIASHIPGTKLNQVAKDMESINGGKDTSLAESDALKNKVKHEDDSEDLYQEGKPRRSGRHKYSTGFNPRAWLRDHNMTLAEYRRLRERSEHIQRDGESGNRHGDNQRENDRERDDSQRRNDRERENEKKEHLSKERTRKITPKEQLAEKTAIKKAEKEEQKKERIIRSGNVKKVKKNLEKLTDQELENAIYRAKLVKDLKRIKRDSRVIGIADRMERTSGMLRAGIKLYNLSADIQNAFNARRDEGDRKKDWVHVNFFNDKNNKGKDKDKNKDRDKK